ncbi:MULTISPECIES: sodium ion-translocating decarboxylase subunit beta [Fusobacterium]|jgi:sodium ion-translocating decarboxylase, beta subunit|uniref:Sodium ion-translocating decarboxylase subunit beta n=4 Tax=Fusobacterium TaxID=848 RepID=A0A2G9EHZ6_9FUSO|nr:MULTISPECIES: sodium ion-translocating decarboxylase subunit beta [Fusobacterium]ATV35259.1 sodium ion-translocating decarboxylase subunit beta [Fusobacterium pseudoperiodonticum]ATV58562.1 sodium ion-translocating decarboxylase subunit beta [Fusobacterium pseudoperiodonticum]ATV61846.1 sodium ion-translocating decarboxylase subunit beta [Fusobacterium pseudoperiodonticum]AVQ24843.1 sodium ion-translocating decarboxylase subunit beta [Fusobacterium periodonticum]EKA94061.1 sodium ion-transl
MNFFNVLAELLEASGFAALTWQNIAMILVSFVLFYLAIVKKFEPLLLLPISFGMFLVNLPLAGLMDEGGIIYLMSYGVKSNLFPCLVFMGVGAMTDFSPLIANPISLLLGAAAQLGIYVAFIFATQIGFTPAEAAAIGIIGGADGPTSIYIANNLAPHLLAPIAVAAYSYMALIPLIQPPIMKLLTTKKERAVKMGQLRKVSKTEKIVFPIAVVLFCSLLLPSVAPLLGLLMMGNLFKESGVVQRLSDTAQNAMINIITIMLGLSVGAKADGSTFLDVSTLKIIAMGLAAFCFSTAGGVILGKILYYVTGGKINPLIGSAGVSAVPMAARVSQTVGAKENPTNFLLMHAMGPNVAGVIGSAVAAGFFMMIFKGTM